MKANKYMELSKTAEGRKKAHEIMLSDVRARMDRMIATLPDGERGKCTRMFDDSFVKISSLGNGNLFAFFADDDISDANFASYCDDLLNARLLY